MMKISSNNYFPELGMEDPIFNHDYQMDPFGYPLEGLDFPSFSASGESYPSFNSQESKRTTHTFPAESPESVGPTRPTKQLKTTSWNSCASDQFMAPKANSVSSSISSSQLISFQKTESSVASQQFNYNLVPNVKPKTENVYNENVDFAALISQDENKNLFKYEKGPNTVTRNPLQAQDHVMAERKRREKLSQRFIALSAIIPGLKKVDKASVLGDAVKYVKQLQERVKELEEQVTKKTVDSAVFVKKSVIWDDENSENQSRQPLPEVEARISDMDVLIKIHCEKHKARAAQLLNELDKLHLTVQSSSFLPFGNTTLHITIVARMDKEYCMTAKDLVRSLTQALGQFI